MSRGLCGRGRHGYHKGVRLNARDEVRSTHGRGHRRSVGGRFAGRRRIEVHSGARILLAVIARSLCVRIRLEGLRVDGPFRDL